MAPPSELVDPKLTIVIPALNEEQSIKSIVERCLAQRENLMRECGLSEVEIVVVSDGSTDQTAPIAQTYEPDIRVIIFPKNRGYGAAIKEGWRVSGGDLLSFLDADGTCDPALFIPMCKSALSGTHVTLGNRLHEDSAMPPIRRFGNKIFALLLGYLSQESVDDTASGMRVVRRDALHKLYPLPDGLHFTPSMSAVCLVDRELTIAEIKMPYKEREGQSKLHVVKDGIRFLKTILAAVLVMRPRRVVAPALWLLGLVVVLLAASPVLMYAREQAIEEGHIYRLLVVTLLGGVGATLFCATYLSEHMIAMGHHRLEAYEAGTDRLISRTTFRVLVTITGIFCLGSLIFVSPAAWDVLTEGSTEVHWSRLLLATLAMLLFSQFAVTALVLKLVRALDRKLAAFHEVDGPA